MGGDAEVWMRWMLAGLIGFVPGTLIGSFAVSLFGGSPENGIAVGVGVLLGCWIAGVLHVLSRGEAVNPASLRRLDRQIMEAINQLSPRAYAVPIQEAIEHWNGREPPSLGSIYVALDRLTRKGHVKTLAGEATKERGGRPMLYFTLTDEGREALSRPTDTGEK